MTCPALRPARPADLDAALGLLAEAGLPTGGVREAFSEFIVAEVEGSLAGVAGVERYGDAALLRSVAVAPTWRGTGIGRALIDDVLGRVAASGVKDVYLLTTSAEHYFPRHGFRCIRRDEVPAAVQASGEFTSACPASATVMHRALDGAAG
ncbi:MAG: arsenic resistance N-acetyltransferase ArsN2 [Gemmatimonadota bacterium]